MTTKNIFDFFDNEIFVKVNQNKNFSDEDKVAIVIRSVTRSLNEKFEFLNDIAKSSNEDLAYQIQKWIEKTKLQVEYLLNLRANEDQSIYTVSNICDSDDALVKTFSNLQKAIDESCPYEIVYINKNNTEKNIAKIYLSYVDEFQTNDIFDRISNVECMPVQLDNYKVKEGFKFTIFEHKVELNSPFKPFDFVVDSKNYLTSFIVADKRDPMVQEVIKSSRNKRKLSTRTAWLKLNIPTYIIRRSHYITGESETSDTTLETRYDYEYLHCKLSELRVIDPEDLNSRTKEMIKRIKAELQKEDRLFD